ncbi:MAG TPA: nucleotide exchange factor GrpE [Candidatus Limiplasma sp.]|nr:nucleotide exchange factor GrpE [Candidatus Limiplasma sp.]HRX09698.1 nucleotide exchange factor GrpE [Candidatus Limiplasma sp.]
MAKDKTVKPDEKTPEATEEMLPKDGETVVEEIAEDVKADMEALQVSLAEANCKVDEYLTLAQRVQADFDNYRRRNQNVRGEAFEDGAKSIIQLLLPVLDNMERAMEAAECSQDKALKEGMEMVARQLNEVFDKRGVTPIQRLGEKFDPNLENAILTGSPEDGEAGTVCQVLQKGYRIGDTVLRHAMVKVVPEA